jgi:1-acyl-sn-glycerol-3-phosphate acyltransferase
MKTLAWALLNTVQAILLAPWTVFCSLSAVVLWPFGRDLPLVMARIWSRPLLWLGIARLQIERTAEIDWSRPHIYMMNHQSMLDIPVAFLAVPTPLRFIAKRSLSHVPFLGWYMRATGMIFVDRGRSSQAIASLQAAAARIRDGASIIAFPEGTRSRDGAIHPFKKGTFVVAIEAQVPIVPMAVHGASYVLPPDGFQVRPGKIRVKVGAPIPTAGLTVEDRDALAQQVREEVIRLQRSIGGPGGELGIDPRRVTPPAKGEASKRTA